MATGGSDESRSDSTIAPRPEHDEGDGALPSLSDGELPSTGRHAAGVQSAVLSAPPGTSPIRTAPQPRLAAAIPAEAPLASTPPALARVVSPPLTPVASVPPLASAEDANALTQQMPRVGRRRPTAAVVSIGIAIVVLLVAGATALATKANDRGTPNGPATAATARASGGTGPGPLQHLTANIPLGDGRALLAKIVAAPRHAHLYRIDGSDGGVMNVTQYAAHYFSGARTESARLTSEGFRVAASTDFVRPDGLEVATHLAQFDDADGALSYFLGEKSGWNSNNTVTDTFDIADVVDGVGYEVATADALGNRRVAMYAHVGNIVVVINAYTRGRIDADVDARLLRSQVTALR
jgi:hypothetical protein